MTRGIHTEFEAVLKDTKYCRKILGSMKPVMDWELNQKNDPERLVRAVRHALEARNLRARYRVGTGKLLALLEILPD